ncbi:rhodanese-like domain-containing protein [Alkalibacterium olivapovliticus]|uniref:Rhodanese-related sulfurtransferase n=1 Tax=Alkalibacterium olivapovliticus TaxID=99907 RepID=A0A2T0W6I1_9LACT|nr:rhodanese-like domain-containing protein [Alkalibacterium olivapovliticus]PRY82299.1 rhodanese-related sulfurtransferase [Alkalibacterium olivapovliticus]
MYRSVSMDEFGQKQKREEICIIDVREADEFSSGHIPGAVSMPLSGLAQGYEGLDKGTEYHVVCLSGGRSSMACEFLSNEGYDVVNVMGGMSAWRGEIE